MLDIVFVLFILGLCATVFFSYSKDKNWTTLLGLYPKNSKKKIDGKIGFIAFKLDLNSKLFFSNYLKIKIDTDSIFITHMLPLNLFFKTIEIPVDDIKSKQKSSIAGKQYLKLQLKKLPDGYFCIPIEYSDDL